MKKYLIPASITAVAVGAFLVFQNAGIVSPTLGTWTTVAKLSKPIGPGSYVGVTEVPKFNISVLDCELRLKYVYETDGMVFMGGGTTPKQLAVGVEYPNRVTRSSLGQWTLQFSNSSGIGPFNTGMTSTPPPSPIVGMSGGIPRQSPSSSQYSISFNPAFDVNPNQLMFSVYTPAGGITGVNVAGSNVTIGPALGANVKSVILEKRCYSILPSTTSGHVSLNEEANF